MKNTVVLLIAFLALSLLFTGCKIENKPTAPVKITMCGSYYGNYDLNPYISSNKLIVQRILLNIAKEHKTLKEIAESLNVNPVFIEDELAHLGEADLVRSVDGMYIANGIIISNGDKNIIKPFAQTIAGQIAELIIDELDSIKLAYGKCSFKDQGFTWEQMKNLFIYTQLLDLNLIDRGFAIHRIASGKPPVHKNLGEWFLHGIEGDPIEKYALTHNICPIDSGGCAILYCDWNDKNLHPSKISFSDNDLAILVHLYKGEKTENELMNECGLKMEEVRESLKAFTELRVVEKTGNFYKVIIPIYHTKDIPIMLVTLDNISEKIIDKYCQPNLNKIEELFYKCGFGENKEQYGAFEREIFVTIVNIATQILIEKNEIPSPPTHSPWIVWGWTGNAIWDE
ncbi:MAG TPA: hypothetical protein VHO72_01435 [Bacteroidales bacterium]|nr:hypothetical protein [Bacteroidales bacterium]